MEQVKHIKSISVENFKCFDHFSVNDFGMYNIILGDNNVGKTSFLESLLFDENISQTIYNFQSILVFKNILTDSQAIGINPFSFFINRYSKNGNVVVDVKFVNFNGFKLSLQPLKINDISSEDLNNFHRPIGNIANDILKINTQRGDFYRSYDVKQNFENYSYFIPYVFSTAYYNTDLVRFYTENFSQSRDSKEILIENLKSVVPFVTNIEITLNFANQTPLIGIWVEDKDSLLPLPLFGDGTIRLFRLIMEIVVSKNKYLCIDEIDTGIHYSKYKDFSRIVLNTAAANNVQLFITTHNNEFLKSFKEVLEEKDFLSYQEQTKCFTLKKLPKGDIKAYRYDFEEFEFAIEQENELR